MRVAVVTDNQADGDFSAEFGLSFLIETPSGDILFDTGQTGVWLDNMRRIGKDPSRLVGIALSHGHYDHSGGIPAASEWMESITCYAHPDALRAKYSIDERGARNIGIPEESLRFETRFSLSDASREILPGVVLSGEIPIWSEGAITVKDQFFLDAEKRVPDTFADEQCLILKEGGSVGLLLGCSHRGMENNVRAAMDIAGTNRFEWIAGGIHLGRASKDQLEDLCSFIESIEVKRVICCHCTGDAAFRYLRERLGGRIIQGTTGMEWSL